MNIIKQLKDVNGNNIYPIAYAQGGMKMDLLWTNPSPTSSFSAQTVSVDLSEYDAFIISTYRSTDKKNSIYNNFITQKDVYSSLFSYDVGVNNIYCRGATLSDGGVTFSSGYASTSTTADNATCIPYQIYGIKMSYVVPTSVHGLQYVEV